MHFQLGPVVPFEDFSYLIAKNPASPPYVRDLSTAHDGTRRVVGKYIDNATMYTLRVENDAVRLVERLREENRAAYVSASPYAVNPRNLKCVVHALKSAIHGQVVAPMTPDRVQAPSKFLAEFGPILVPENIATETYKGLGLELTTTPMLHGTVARMVSVRNDEPMSLAEFLQRVFVGAYALTTKDHEEPYYQESLVDALLELSKRWLATCPNCDQVVARLSGYRKGTIKRFTAGLDRPEETPSDENTDADRREQAVETKIGLHQRRHLTILRLVAETFPAESIKTILDLGCGEGKLTAKLSAAYPHAHITAIDADFRAKRNLRGTSVRFLSNNLTVPYLETTDLRPDILVLSEIIEHLGATDRALLIKHVAKMWCPHLVVLTTPNVAYNPTWGLAPGEFRHYDHRIEYTGDDLRREVLQPLTEAGYACRVVPVDGFEDEPIQPSFVVLAVSIRSDSSPDLRYLYRARDMHAPLALEEVGYTVTPAELRDGIRQPVYRHHRASAFYLAPTMAPVDYNPEYPDHLEHPTTAFDYYAKRGVTKVVVQPKSMGSRCHLLAFRNHMTAQQMGFDQVIVAISRNGYPLFNPRRDAALLSSIHDSIQWSETDDDVLAMDGELMPWSFKAGNHGDRPGLIDRQFRGPGEAAYLYESCRGSSAADEKKFLEVLEWFASDDTPSIRLFGFLMSAKVRNGKFCEVVAQHRFDHTEQLVKLTHLLHYNEVLKVVETRYLDTVFWSDVKKFEQWWLTYTVWGRGEGFVVKPKDPKQTTLYGSPIQPALKVRGRDYLRLIYGIKYLEPEIFAKLTKRHTSAKRRLALQEHALSLRMMTAFFRGMRREHEKYVAAFLGMEGLAAPSLDATL